MKHLFPLFLLVLVAACGNSYKNDPLGDSGRTQRTEHLLTNLAVQADTAGFLVGHTDDTLYGVGWQQENGRSDIKSVVNDLPALLALDISGVETSRKVNSTGMALRTVRAAAMKHFDKGGVVLLSWDSPHRLIDADLDSAADSIAAFLKGLVMPYGVRVPVLLRPISDGKGWASRLTADEYRATWHHLIERLRHDDVVNALFVYSFTSLRACYPDDADVDVLELRQQFSVNSSNPNLFLALCGLRNYCHQHHKLMGLVTGLRGLRSDDWWTKTLAPAIMRFPLAYVTFGANSDHTVGDFYVPYPGQQSAHDFVRFYNLPRTLFLHDVNGMYVK
jgi:mannan endo-1,4-beta-mannosidase